MNDKPLTKGDLQTILDHITSERRKGDNYVNQKLGEVNDRLDSIEDDVSTIAQNTGHKRDRKGQLRKSA